MTSFIAWRPAPARLADDEALCDAVLSAYHAMDPAGGGFDPGGLQNPDLGFEIRGFRRRGAWRMFLLLTPWMLARLLFADHDPRIPVAAMTASPGLDSDLLGPRVRVDLLDTAQDAHLTTRPELGSYLAQPLVMAMGLFDRPDAVFAAWSAVIRTRDAKMREAMGNCQWQREMSRWELLAPLKDFHADATGASTA